MPPTPTSGRPRAPFALWIVLILSWIVLLPMLWTAFSTVPSPERLAQSRMVRIPTLESLGLLVGRSAVELGVLLVLLVPWRRRFYLTRLSLAAVGVWAWFIGSTPLGLSQMTWLHRRWLAAVGAVLVVWAGVVALGRVVETLRTRPPATPASP